MHGGWQFLSALFLMQQTLAIMEATNGNIQNISHYSSKAEWHGVLQACEDPVLLSPTARSFIPNYPCPSCARALHGSPPPGT